MLFSVSLNVPSCPSIWPWIGPEVAFPCLIDFKVRSLVGVVRGGSNIFLSKSPALYGPPARAWSPQELVFVAPPALTTVTWRSSGCFPGRPRPNQKVPESPQNRPRINPLSILNQPRIDPESIQDSPRMFPGWSGDPPGDPPGGPPLNPSRSRAIPAPVLA